MWREFEFLIFESGSTCCAGESLAGGSERERDNRPNAHENLFGHLVAQDVAETGQGPTPQFLSKRTCVCEVLLGLKLHMDFARCAKLTKNLFAWDFARIQGYTGICLL